MEATVKERRTTGLQAGVVDPLRDARWDALVDNHPHASVFHTRGWLAALQRTYGYKPLAVTTSPADEPLANGIVFCAIRSWATGFRLVSLPFSDHCDPLLDNAGDLETLVGYLRREGASSNCRYVELRPRLLAPELAGRMHLDADESHCLHELDLTPGLESIYARFHKSCIRRKIRKAEREGLSHESGRSEELLAKFYKLLLTTRRRHELPPQPVEWFRNLADCLGEKITFRVVSRQGMAIASMVTTQFRDTCVYKYGCSDARYHRFGGVSLLIWSAIQDAKAAGARRFDFGRSDRSNRGLIQFKDHWGAIQTPLYYYRYPGGRSDSSRSRWKLWLIRKTCAYLPDPLLGSVGAGLYRHVG